MKSYELWKSNLWTNSSVEYTIHCTVSHLFVLLKYRTITTQSKNVSVCVGTKCVWFWLFSYTNTATLTTSYGQVHPLIPLLNMKELTARSQKKMTASANTTSQKGQLVWLVKLVNDLSQREVCENKGKSKPRRKRWQSNAEVINLRCEYLVCLEFQSRELNLSCFCRRDA